MCYDQHVLLLIMGPGIKGGQYARRVCPTGLVVALCKLLDVPPPDGAPGELLSEALAP